MRQRGFTLVELLVAGVVGVILVGLAWPAYRGTLQRAARTEAIEALYRLQLAQERHREMFGIYAADLPPLRMAAVTPGGRYQLSLARSGIEQYRAFAQPSADAATKPVDAACAVLTLDVREGFATLGPDGRCWNR